jgi:hypothetical protein
MKKIPFLAFFALASAGMILVFSCNKAKVDTNTTTASDYSMCQNEFIHLLPMFNSIACKKSMVRGIEYRVSSGGAPHWPQVTYDTTHGWPRTITVNYGGGVTDSIDGQTRAGIVKGAFADYWDNLSTTSLTITFVGYSVNNNSYGGTVTVYRNHQSLTQFSANISGICNVTGYPPLLFNANGLSYNWVNGVYPPDTIPWQGQYAINGSGTGQDRNQVKYTFVISGTLIKNNNCANVSQGIVTITPAGLANRIVTYTGGNNCNTSATVTIDGQNYTITSN